MNTLVDLPMLKTINPGYYGFTKVDSFVIDNLPSLEVVTFGQYSFTYSSSSQKSNSELVITNCPKLMRLTVYGYSLRDFQKLTMYNLTSIESITTYDYAFQLLSTIQLSGILVMNNQ